MAPLPDGTARATRQLLALAGLWMALVSPAAADSWVVCDYDVTAVRADRASGLLTVRVLNARGRLSAECPPAAGEMSFRPETRNYQSELPRRQWPRAGEHARLRYRHLDGICKSSGPCRIRHHSLLAAW